MNLLIIYIDLTGLDALTRLDSTRLEVTRIGSS